MLTLILTILTSFLLPLLTTASGPEVWEPAHWPPPTQQYYYWGDMLNVTKCYCEGTKEAPDQASYYLFEYRNFHNAQTYALNLSCESNKMETGWGSNGPKRVSFPIPECWNGHDSWREKKRKECRPSYNADLFCFELGNKADPHDHYYFNGQKRGLPDQGFEEFSPDRCVAFCRDKVGGRTVASDREGSFSKSVPGLDNPLLTVKSSYRSYTTLDDIVAN